jgi:hypothetical protein
MITIATLGVFGVAVFFLAYIKTLEPDSLSVGLQRGAKVAKHLLALFASVYGSAVVAVLLSLPLFLFSRLAKNEVAAELWSALLDRPYFPLQVVVACILGGLLLRWVHDAWPKFVWVLPSLQFAIALVVFRQRFPFQADWQGIRRVFFNWDCGCSASLPQWTVILPLYTSIAFALGAFARSCVTREFGISTSEAYREFQRTKVH